MELKQTLAYGKNHEKMPPSKIHPYLKEIETSLQTYGIESFRSGTQLCFDLQYNRIILRYNEGYISFRLGMGQNNQFFKAWGDWRYDIACDEYADQRLKRFHAACERLKSMFVAQMKARPTSSDRFAQATSLHSRA